MTTQTLSKAYSVADVAAMFAVTRGTVHNWIRSGVLPKPRKFGNSIRWPVQEIDTLLEAAK